jgi:hypothetical protein
MDVPAGLLDLHKHQCHPHPSEKRDNPILEKCLKDLL